MEASAGLSAAKWSAKNQRRKVNEASSTRSLHAIDRGRADYKKASSKDEVLRPVSPSRKRAVSFKTCKESRAESERKVKKGWNLNDMTGTVLLFNNKVHSCLPVEVWFRKKFFHSQQACQCPT